MAYDTLVMAAVAAELQERISGARVQRVFQPGRDEVILSLHRHGEQLLLLSGHSRHARVHLTEERPRNPEKPFPFCMLLRKYLVGGAVASVVQQPLERVLEIMFDPPEGMAPVRLIAEIMGRRSNLVLVDRHGVILGALRTATPVQNPLRTVMPGEPYRPVPAQLKLDPLDAEEEEFSKTFTAALGEGGNAAQALVAAVRGVSPLTARELLCRGGWDEPGGESSARRLFHAMRELFRSCTAGRERPFLSLKRDLYAAFPLTHLPAEEQTSFDDINRMLDYYYRAAIERERALQIRETLTARIGKQVARLERKREEQREELRRAGEADQYRLYGELLLAFAARVSPGAREAELDDLYHPGQTVHVPLDPGLSAGANAQKHFARYRKLAKGRQQIRKQLEQTDAEIHYCLEILFAIENGDRQSLEEIREELVEAGYMKAQKKAAKPAKAEPRPLSFQASSGRLIAVGRNNRQNDCLTFKTAARRDTWLHVHDLPGSHVLIKGAPYPPPEEDLEEAALLAAHFSRGRHNPAVAVDYTEARHVRRGPGGRPGFALYANFQTITVNPKDERLQKLLEQHPQIPQ